MEQLAPWSCECSVAGYLQEKIGQPFVRDDIKISCHGKAGWKNDGIAISTTFNNEGQEKLKRNMQAFWQKKWKNKPLVQEKMKDLHRKKWIDTDLNGGVWSAVVPRNITWKDTTNIRQNIYFVILFLTFFIAPCP